MAAPSGRRARRYLDRSPQGVPCNVARIGECDDLHLWFHRLESVTFPRISCSRGVRREFRESIMIGLVRAVTICATLAFGLSAACAADKAFKRDDLADSAIKLEAQIKSEAGPVAKTNATLKTDADAAFRRNDYRTGLSVLGQIAALTPDDSSNWLRLARTIFQIRPANSNEQTFLLERASTAA